MFELLLPLHATCAVVSVLLFCWRGILMWRDTPLQNRLLKRALPDSVDSLLLITGITMAFSLEISPLDSGWLAAKIIALLAYIVLGAVALKYGRSKLIKRSSFIAALCVFVYIISVAKTMQVLPWASL